MSVFSQILGGLQLHEKRQRQAILGQKLLARGDEVRSDEKEEQEAEEEEEEMEMEAGGDNKENDEDYVENPDEEDCEDNSSNCDGSSQGSSDDSSEGSHSGDESTNHHSLTVSDSDESAGNPSGDEDGDEDGSGLGEGEGEDGDGSGLGEGEDGDGSGLGEGEGEGEGENGVGSDSDLAMEGSGTVTQRAAGRRVQPTRAPTTTSAAAPKISSVLKSLKSATLGSPKTTTGRSSSTNNRAPPPITVCKSKPASKPLGKAVSDKDQKGSSRVAAATKDVSKSTRSSVDQADKKKRKRVNHGTYDLEKSSKTIVSVDLASSAAPDKRENTFFSLKRDFINKGIARLSFYFVFPDFVFSRFVGSLSEALSDRPKERPCVLLDAPNCRPCAGRCPFVQLASFDRILHAHFHAGGFDGFVQPADRRPFNRQLQDAARCGDRRSGEDYEGDEAHGAKLHDQLQERTD